MVIWGDAVGRLLVGVALVGAACTGVALHGQSPPPGVPLTPVAYGPPVPVPAQPPRVEPVGAAVMGRSLPLRLTLPRLHVSSSLLHVGQAPDGTVAVPPPGPSYDRAAWYRYSPAPGSLGPAVIVGHVDSKAGGPSVFFDLGRLRRGDLVEVARADGTLARFAVDDVRRYRKASFPTASVYADTDRAALRLITCGGPFDRATGHYLDNVVVSASLLPATLRGQRTAAGE